MLAQTNRAWDPDDLSGLNLANPMRRDVAMLPGHGHLVLGFYTDNPGVWLAHCHIGWHTSQGLALQLIERASDIPALYRDTAGSDLDLDHVCRAWNDWERHLDIIQDDSGV